MNTAGLGSANSAWVTGRSASAWARPSSTLPASPHSIISTNGSVHTCADAQMVPAPPMSTSGNRNGSSPPSTANPSIWFAPASSSSVSTSRPVAACLIAGEVRVRGELEHAGGAEVAAGADGDVVDDDRHRARLGDRAEVGDDAGLRRAHVVRHDDQRRDERGRRLRAPATAAIVVCGVVGAGADDELRVALGAHARARVDDGALLVGVERGRLAGGAERDDAGGAGVEVLVAQPLDRVDRDRAVGCERRDERDVDPAQATRSLRHYARTGLPSGGARR